MWQYKNATKKKLDYTTIAGRLRTINWSNDSNPTGVVKPVNGIKIFPLTAKTVSSKGVYRRGSRNFRQRGSNFPKIKTSKKKKKKKRGGQKTEEKTEGCGGSSPSADVIDFPDKYLYIQVFFR